MNPSPEFYILAVAAINGPPENTVGLTAGAFIARSPEHAEERAQKAVLETFPNAKKTHHYLLPVELGKLIDVKKIADKVNLQREQELARRRATGGFSEFRHRAGHILDLIRKLQAIDPQGHNLTDASLAIGGYLTSLDKREDALAKPTKDAK